MPKGSTNLNNYKLPNSEMSKPESDDDTTFNDMVGKFNESYIHDKETNILR